MTIVFATNFLGELQVPFCNSMLKLTGNGFTFVAFTPLSAERASLGYQNRNMLPYVVRAYENQESYNEAMNRITEADVVILGMCPDEVVYARYKIGKPFVFYSERFFKKGTWRRFIPTTYYKIWKRMLRYKNANVRVACASAYLPYDLSLLNSKLKTYKWGYMPEVRMYDDIHQLIKAKKPASILWCARLVELKHPEAAVQVAKKLKAKGYTFTLELIGGGPMEEPLKKLIADNKLGDCVHLLGVMPPDKVRGYMEASRIFLFTSDRNEGWGAVVNESMNSGCAVVASHATGVAPFLLENGVNGFIYRSGDIDDLTAKVKSLLDSQELQESVGMKAYETITTEWNAEVAARRLYEICKAITEGREEPVYESGPCSRAQVITEEYSEYER